MIPWVSDPKPRQSPFSPPRTKVPTPSYDMLQILFQPAVPKHLLPPETLKLLRMFANHLIVFFFNFLLL